VGTKASTATSVARLTANAAPVENLRGSSKNVRILPSISGRFDRSRRLRPDSAKTRENPVHEKTRHKTDEYPVPVTAALIGGFSGVREKA
jgi:hypothetical protein